MYKIFFTSFEWLSLLNSGQTFSLTAAVTTSISSVTPQGSISGLLLTYKILMPHGLTMCFLLGRENDKENPKITRK